MSYKIGNLNYKNRIEFIPTFHFLKWRFLLSKLYIFLFFGSLLLTFAIVNNYQLKELLTPRSVSVSSYERSDGTKVKSYNRRPPGGAIHDSPIEKKMGGFFILGFLGFCCVIFGFIWFFKIKKADVIDHFESLTLKNLNIQITLPDQPYYLVKSSISPYGFYKLYDCCVCGKRINYEEFHISDRSKSKPNKWCIQCSKMKLSDLFINQDVFDFIDDYNTSENHFIHLFQKEIKKLSGFEYYSDNYNAILLFERLVRDILSEREYNSRYSSL